MNKVLLETYWFTWGRWYGDRPRIISRAWLTSILPPFYRGTGIGLRFGPYSLKFGVCYPRMPFSVDPYVWVDPIEEKANLDALVGFELEDGVQEARTWGFDDESEKTASSQSD